MVFLDKTYGGFCHRLQREAEYSRIVLAVFFMIGGIATLVVSSAAGITLSSYQSLYQLAVALNLAISSLDGLIPNADITKYRENVEESQKRLQDYRNAVEQEMHAMEDKAIRDAESFLASSPGLQSISLDLGKIYNKKAESMVGLAKHIGECYDVLLRSKSNRMIEILPARRNRMALFGAVIAFVALLLSSVFPNAGSPGSGWNPTFLALVSGGIIGVCYAPVILTLYGVHLSIQRSDALQHTAARLTFRIRDHLTTKRPPSA